MSCVKDIVQQRELFCVEEHQSVAEVARKMADLHVGAILVFNGAALRGVFSERDLLVRVVVERRDAERDQRPSQSPFFASRPYSVQEQQAENEILGYVRRFADELVQQNQRVVRREGQEPEQHRINEVQRVGVGKFTRGHHEDEARPQDRRQPGDPSLFV